MDMIFVGIEVGVREVFKFPRIPNQNDTPQYAAVIGPFRTMRGARFMRDHGQGNPHCQHVNQAERLAKKYQN